MRSVIVTLPKWWLGKWLKQEGTKQIIHYAIIWGGGGGGGGGHSWEYNIDPPP